MYQQYSPHPSLVPYIDAYWTVITSSSAGAHTSRILPDGCVDIICNIGNEIRSSDTHLASEKAYLIGTMTTYADSSSVAGSRLIGIRFKPAAFASFFDFPLQEATDNCLEFGQELIALLLPAGNHFITVLDQYFLRRLNTSSRVLLPVVDSIRRHNGVIKIADLARQHFLTPRQLERYFLKYTGIAPKAFANIVRYQAVHRHLRNGTTESSLLQIAFSHGYYDHAHLTNDIKKYTGKVPSML